jgi:hypothetical protein
MQNGIPDDILGRSKLPNLLPCREDEFAKAVMDDESLCRLWRFLKAGIETAVAWHTAGGCGDGCDGLLGDKVLPRHRELVSTNDNAMRGVVKDTKTFSDNLARLKRRARRSRKPKKGQGSSGKEVSKEDKQDPGNDQQDGQPGPSDDNNPFSGSKDSGGGQDKGEESGQKTQSGPLRSGRYYKNDAGENTIFQSDSGIMLQTSLQSWLHRDDVNAPPPEDIERRTLTRDGSEVDSEVDSEADQASNHSSASRCPAPFELDIVLKALQACGIALRYVSPHRVDAVIEEMMAEYASGEQSAGM